MSSCAQLLVSFYALMSQLPRVRFVRVRPQAPFWNRAFGVLHNIRIYLLLRMPGGRPHPTGRTPVGDAMILVRIARLAVLCMQAKQRCYPCTRRIDHDLPGLYRTYHWFGTYRYPAPATAKLYCCSAVTRTLLFAAVPSCYEPRSRRCGGKPVRTDHSDPVLVDQPRAILYR